MTFGLAKEGVGFLGFGGCVGMASRLQRMNRTMVSRKVSTFYWPYFTVMLSFSCISHPRGMVQGTRCESKCGFGSE